MKKGIIILSFLMLAEISFAQTCNCTIYPFKPASCRRQCNAKILKSATFSELKLILGLNEAVATKITNSDTSKIQSLDDYKVLLKRAEYNLLTETMENAVNTARVQYFFKATAEDRLKVDKLFEKSQPLLKERIKQDN